MTQDAERLVDRAVDRLVDGIERVLDVGGRLIILERDSLTHEDGIKYLRGALHDVRSGSSTAPGLNQLNVTNRELAMEVKRLQENDQATAKVLEGLLEKVAALNTQAQVQAWKVGTVIAFLLYVANVVTDKLNLFGG